MRIHYILFIFLAILLGCKPDPKIPSWDVEALAPIIHSRLSINDLVHDSSLVANADGLLSLVYQNKLATLLPNEIFEPLNVDFQNTIKLNSIDFGTRTVNDFISLGQLAKGGSPAGQFIIFNNGQSAVVPPIPPVSNKSFNVNATNLFQTVTLTSGNAHLELKNELPVALDNIDFILQNTVSGNTLIQKSLSTLGPGQTYSETFPLNNLTIEGNLRAVLQNFESPGSGSNTVVIDTSDKILITLTLSDLVPTSATAIFPAQELANDTTLTTIQAGNAELTAIKVKEGRIFLDATSTIEDQISLDYLIPNATNSSGILSFREKINAAPPFGSSNTFREVDISGYDVDLTGKPTDFGVYNTFYTILLGRIDSSGNLVNLSLQDSVFLETGIRNLTASEGYGYLGKDTIAGSESSKVDIFGALQQGNFDLDDVRLSISVENRIGAPIDLRLHSLRSQQPTGSVALNWTGLGQNQTTPAATLGSNNIPAQGRLQLDINKTNSNLDKLVENQPTLFTADFSAYINGPTATPDYGQFIFTDYGVDVFLNLEIPLNFSAQNLLLADTNDFSYADLDPKNQLQQGALKVIAENNFPLECAVELVMLDKTGSEIGRLTSADHIKAAKTDADGNAINTEKSIVTYPLTKDHVELLKETKRMVFQVLLNTPLPPQKIKLYNRNFMDLTLSGDLTIRTK